MLDIVDALRHRCNIAAIMIGDGPLAAAVDLAMRVRQLGACIELHGPVSREMLTPFYAAADLLLLTSRVEGLPLAVIEALAICCPVAATDVGDIGRIVRNGVNGCLAPANDPSSLVESIAAIATDPESLPMLRAAARSIGGSGAKGDVCAAFEIPA